MPSMNLPFARRCADRLLEWLGPYCERIEVAGSVRRERPAPADIDLVVIPKRVEERDIFGEVVAKKNAAWIEIQRRAKADAWEITKSGADMVQWVAKGVQVDLWWAEPPYWGTILLCRTGSREHNIWLAEYAKSRGGKWHPHAGLYMGNHRESETEDGIYRILGMDPIPPARREANLLPFAGLLRGAGGPLA